MSTQVASRKGAKRSKTMITGLSIHLVHAFSHRSYPLDFDLANAFFCFDNIHGYTNLVLLNHLTRKYGLWGLDEKNPVGMALW